MESFVGRCGDYFNLQSISVVEREFSIEFCSSGWYYVDWKRNATRGCVEGKAMAVCWWLVDCFIGSTVGYNAVDLALFWTNEQLFCFDQFDSYSYGRSDFDVGIQHVSNVLVRSW